MHFLHLFLFFLALSPTQPTWPSYPLSLNLRYQFSSSCFYCPVALLHMRKKYRCNKGPCYPKKYGTVFHENLTNWAITVSYWSTPIIVSSDSKSSKSDEIQRSHNSAPSESFHRPSSKLDIGVPWSSQTLGGQHAFSPPFPLLPRRFYSPAEWGNPKLWPKQNNKKMQWEV